MFQVFRTIGIYVDPSLLSPTFSSLAAAREWAEEYSKNHPRECGAEALNIRKVKALRRKTPKIAQDIEVQF